MNFRKLSAGVLVLCAALVLTRCAGSNQSSQTSEEKGDTKPPGVQKPVEQPAGGKVSDKIDTVDAKMQSSERRAYDQTPPPPPPSDASGTFAVQVGAYKMQESAEQIAKLARERFGRNVSTTLDRTSNLFKVMVGNFPTKAGARQFRDEMMQRFPSDYKDAWVSDLTQK